MIRRILRMGDPRLLERSKEITQFDTPQLHALVADMFETMEEADGVGLAAPQIGEFVRIVVFGFESNPRYPEAPQVPRTVLINPVLEFLTDATEDGWEGCLSVPGLRGMVPRCTKLRYTGVDQYGGLIDRVAEGFHARVVQHECDHLDGVLYPRRIRDLKQFGFSEEILGSSSTAD